MNLSGNPGMQALAPYPFEKLDRLLGGLQPPTGLAPIPLSIGEPRHEPPGFVLDAYRAALAEGVARYPTIRGGATLRRACANWLARRFSVAVDPETMVQPVTGTREALFAAAQVFCAPGSGQTVDPARLDRARLFYLCNPVNPCGTVATVAYLERLLALAERHDIIVLVDECYVELYRDAAPVSMLNACAAAGDGAYRRVLVFHSLSKRSNLPGLRSGFVAGDPDLVHEYARYRTYHGCSMSLAVQAASSAAWDEDAHVDANRALYNDKYAAVMPALAAHWDVATPPATFYVWLPVGGDETDWTRRLYAETGVTVVPGRYLARDADGSNPGAGYVRISLVASPEQTVEAVQRIAGFQQRYGD